MHRALKLHHRKHTGKLIHHRHTSYWALTFFVLVSGAFTVCIDRMVMADTLVVSATVPAPIPSDPPVFTSPDSGYVSSKAELSFTGTCPVITPAVIITLYSGTILLGSAQCNPSGEFAITGTLVPGTQSVTAKVITITGQDGQTSTPLSVTYTPVPKPPVTPPKVTRTSFRQPQPPVTIEEPAVTTPESPTADPVILAPNTSFITYRPGVGTDIGITFTGGSKPYKVTLDWGDGTKETKQIPDHQLYTFSHVYETKGSYVLLVTTIDATGTVTTTHYAVIDLSPNIAPAGTTAASLLDELSTHIMTVPLVLYLSLLAAVLVLWRYEHTHHRQRVGIPTHYHWQRKKLHHK